MDYVSVFCQLYTLALLSRLDFSYPPFICNRAGGKMQECRKSGIYNVGFIDPNVIHEECVRQYPNRTENNLVMSLEGQHDRTFILLPYNFK